MWLKFPAGEVGEASRVYLKWVQCGLRVHKPEDCSNEVMGECGVGQPNPFVWSVVTSWLSTVTHLQLHTNVPPPPQSQAVLEATKWLSTQT